MGLPIQTRADFKALSKTRLEEARLLLAARKWDGAYYLAGYAVELGLKACIMKLLKRRDAFPERKFSENCYTHDLGKLVGLADLVGALTESRKVDAAFSENWLLVEAWDEVSRYNRWTAAETQALYDAVADADHGVYSWIRARW